MKLKYKLSLTLILTTLFVLLVGLGMLALSFLRTTEVQEKEAVKKELNQAENLIKKNISILASIVGDWAPWDDTFEYMRYQNQEYIDNNLNYPTLDNLNVDMVFFYDNQGKRVASFYVDKENEEIVRADKHLDLIFDQYYPKLNQHPTLGTAVSGIIIEGNDLYMVASQGITDSIMEAPKTGVLVFGKKIDIEVIEEIRQILGSYINLEKLDKEKNNPDTYKLAEAIKDKQVDSVVSEPVNQEYIKGVTLLEDLNGNSEILLSLDMYRQVFIDGIDYLLLNFLIFVLLIVIIGFSTTKLMHKYITTPVRRVSSFLNDIDFDKELYKDRLLESGNNEITLISQDINKMLDRLDESRKNLIESEHKLRMSLDSAHAGIWNYHFADQSISMDKRGYSILGLSETTMNNKLLKVKEYVHSGDISVLNDAFERVKKKKSEFLNIECRLKTLEGSYKWFLLRGNLIQVQEGVGVSGIIIDINEKKIIEEKLEYLSYHDRLTGLFNRRFFDEKLRELEAKGEWPLSIIIGDINGLKLLNDSFGHVKGDILLKEASIALKNSCSEGDYICRWGGDEFAILLPNASGEDAEKVIRKIKDECRQIKVDPIEMNIALGYATKDQANQDINLVLREAEDKMFKNKLFESRSVRSEILTALLTTLKKKSDETEEHTQMMVTLCRKIADKMNFTETQKDDISLLASTHDIGKIAIPDEILNKKESLNDEEWEIIKTHSEVGYRIANAIGDISHVAYGILSHHERYDGTGYPQGLKGEEIPLLVRIVSIVDAYDVITHDRPYKKAMSSKAAIEEIQRQKGKQFDPDLVDICVEVFKQG